MYPLFLYGGDAALHRTARYRNRGTAISIPLAVKGLALLFILCVFVRAVSTLGADNTSRNLMSGLATNTGVVDGILNFELGFGGQTDRTVVLASLILDSSILGANGQQVAETTLSSAAPSAVSGGDSVDTADASGEGLYYDIGKMDNQADSTPNIITKPASQTDPAVISVNNRTDYTFNADALLKEPLNITLSGDSPSILIIHTHSSEAYMPDGNDKYQASDPYRTEDKNFSIIRVGDELGNAFSKNDISFLHDRNIYDYPSYQGAYNRSYESIQSYLKKYPSIKMVIDLHRDAIEAADGSVFKTIAQVGDTTCSQVLLVVGTNASGLVHPNWRENFKLALHIQKEMNTLYPSLAKPIELSQYRYNQQATTGSMIVEIGCTGNTLQESLTAVRYFADAASKVLHSLNK